jgi:hypothetical protein
MTVALVRECLYQDLPAGIHAEKTDAYVCTIGYGQFTRLACLGKLNAARIGGLPGEHLLGKSMAGLVAVFACPIQIIPVA